MNKLKWNRRINETEKQKEQIKGNSIDIET